MGPMSTPESTVVHLMRHGEVHNPDGILYGRLPGFRLSELGRAMATEVAQHLAAHDIVHVVSCLLYTSPSPRDRTRSRMPSSA